VVVRPLGRGRIIRYVTVTVKLPTLADVAREAGVSKTTASIVLRNSQPPNIPPATCQRVRDAAQRLGYVRNQAGLELRSRANTTIGFISDGTAQGPFAGEMIRGAQSAAWHKGFLLMIVETGHDPQLISEAVTRFTERRAHRIIYAPFAHEEAELPDDLARANPILANASDASGRFSSFVPDEFGGGKLATEKLLSIRTEPVGFINIALEVPAGPGRLAGYRAALADAGVGYDETYVAQTSPDHSNAVDGYRAARALFRRHRDLRLLFCATDRMAMGAYDYLKETGHRVPQDVAVVGFDNQLLIAEQVRPPLTTVALPHYEMGKRAVQLALSQPEDAPARQTILPGRLITRSST
jgi:LacI family transcriptional regulator